MTPSCSPSSKPAYPRLGAFAKGIRGWPGEMLGYFNEPTTKRYAEGVISQVKVIKRRAYGLLPSLALQAT